MSPHLRQGSIRARENDHDNTELRRKNLIFNPDTGCPARLPFRHPCARVPRDECRGLDSNQHVRNSVST
jgi:hypothetical protein